MTSLQIVIDLAYVSLATTVIVPFILLFLRIKPAEISFKFLFIYFYLAALSELVLLFMQRQGINNMPVINIFSLLEFGLLSGFLLFLPITKNKNILGTLVLGIIIFDLLHYFLINPLSSFDSVAMTIQNISLTIFSASVLIKVARDYTHPIFKNPLFWFSIAIFFYFSVNVAVFCTGNFLLDDHTHLRKYTWIVNSLMTILSNFFYAIGILCLRKKKILSL